MVLNEGKEMHGSKAGPDTSADDAWPFFVDFLKEKGSRITQARRIVFEHVFARHDHFRADDLAGELATGANHVSRGTVYRTLDLMTEAVLALQKMEHHISPNIMLTKMNMKAFDPIRNTEDFKSLIKKIEMATITLQEKTP